jgi:hypothetical protein
MARTPDPKQSAKQADDPPSRRGWVSPVASDATLAGRAAFARAGFTDPTLVLRWNEIAGPEIARIARPLKFSEASGVLTLLAEPGAALFLGHDSRTLTGRINGYLGRNAVARIKFVQGLLAPGPQAARPPRPGPAPGTQDPVHKYRGPEGLKTALERLARWRVPRQER